MNEYPMPNNLNPTTLLPITPYNIQMMLKAQKMLQKPPEDATLKERVVGLPGTILAKGKELNRLVHDKEKLQEIGTNLKSTMNNYGKDLMKGIKDGDKASAAAVGAIANAAATGLNALNIGERDYGDVNRPGYTFNGMATGASLGAMPALAAATGGLSIAAGALIGGAFDAGKFIKGNKQFKKDMYVTRMKKQQDVLDINKFDYTGLAR